MNSYDQYAEQWTERSSKLFSHVFIERPAMSAKLPDLRGKRVLCVGCGSGEECGELAERGADVVGIDSSAKLIEIARTSFPAVSFHAMDMEQIDLPGDSFDFVYSSLTMHYKESWNKTLQGIAQTMKPGTTFLFSTLHPATWGAETIDEAEHKARLLGYEQTGSSITVHGDYLSTRQIHDNWWGFFDVDFYIRPLMDYFADIRKAGFEIVDLIEPAAVPAGESVDPLQYARYRKLPMFVIFEIKKS